MKFWLTTLGLISVLETPNCDKQVVTNGSGTGTESSTVTPPSSTTPKSNKELDYFCLNRILIALSDNLYDIYCDFDSAKDLWNALESEYGYDDVGVHRFSASSFNNFKMVDDKPIGEQLHIFQDHIRYLESKGSKFSDEYKVSTLIDKLPPGWFEFARELRHNQSSLTLNGAIVKVRIENEHRLNEKSKTEDLPKANLAEKSNTNDQGKHHFKPKSRPFKFNHKNQFHNNKKPSHKPNDGPKTHTKFCYVCGRTNHLAPACYYKKNAPIQAQNQKTSAPTQQVNMIDGHSSGGSFRNNVEEV